MMLESHNDSAVAIAEYVGGSVEGFAAMMNEKARELGCVSTLLYYPQWPGCTGQPWASMPQTARELGLIMRYGIQNDLFLEITRTTAYTFFGC